MKKLTFIAVLCMFVLVLPFINCGQNAASKKLIKNITYTTLDVKHDYEIIQVISGYSETTTTPTKDSFMKAYAAAWSNLATEAYNLKVDAVVGIRVEFVTATDNLRIIVYGTAVKYK